MNKLNSAALKSAGDRAFRNTYGCMQLVNICVLYEYFDFDEDKCKQVTNLFLENDEEITRQSYKWAETKTGPAPHLIWAKEIEAAYGSNVFRFLYGALTALQKRKLALIPKGMHDVQRIKSLLANVDHALYIFFITMFKTLKETCGFTADDVNIYTDGFSEICKLFQKGMTAQWIEKYIRTEIGWDLEVVDL